VAAAPSVTAAGCYGWEVHPRTPLSAWPEWLVTAPKRRPSTPQIPVSTRWLFSAAPSAGETLLAGLARTVAEAPQGTRNDRLFWAACRLAEHAAAGRVPLDVGAAALLAAAAEAGLPEWEADRTLRSALRRAVAS
jgi:hypothetical protein